MRIRRTDSHGLHPPLACRVVVRALPVWRFRERYQILKVGKKTRYRTFVVDYSACSPDNNSLCGDRWKSERFADGGPERLL